MKNMKPQLATSCLTEALGTVVPQLTKICNICEAINSKLPPVAFKIQPQKDHCNSYMKSSMTCLTTLAICSSASVVWYKSLQT